MTPLECEIIVGSIPAGAISRKGGSIWECRVIGALEYPLQNVPFVVPGADLNPCTGQNAPRYAALLPFDSEPEVEVSVGLQVSYRIR